MGRVLITIAVVLALLLVAHAYSAWSFRRHAASLGREIGASGNSEPRGDLPAAVYAFAQRGLIGAAPQSTPLSLTQAAEMAFSPGAWQGIDAQQIIGTVETGFVWQATQSKGPLTMVRVIDAFTDGVGLLEVRLLGSIPVGKESGPLADHGEAMRYLAELPWAPDAILLNRDLHWQVLDSGAVEVRLPMDPQDAVVRFELDDQGDFAVMRAEDRYSGMENGAPVYKDWEGHFTSYGVVGTRRIPTKGEVGYVVDGEYLPYWRGTITGLTRR